MGFDDPVVIVLIVAVALFLFGSSKIPQFARSLGQTRREFVNAFNGKDPPSSNATEKKVEQ